MKNRVAIWTWLIAASMVLSLTGCSTPVVPDSNPAPQTTLPRGFFQATEDGVTIQAVGNSSGDTLLWSPSGSHFAFTVNPQQGTAVIGTTSPTLPKSVELGAGRTMVALTDQYAVVTSASANQDWLYPLQGTSLGKPLPWTAATDTWQEWVDTTKGPAVVTGGYIPESLALTWSDSSSIQLRGGQVYPSADHRFGAVVSKTRMTRLVHPVGDVMAPSEYQPAPATDPIVLWNFGDRGGPRQLATIQLPLADLPKETNNPELQIVQFSPNDKYLAVLVVGEAGTGGQLLGKTFIFTTGSERLVGEAPYGNSLKWSADSKALWIGTPKPQGQGTDRIVNVHGHTLSSWPDAMNRSVVMPISGDKLLIVADNQLQVWKEGTGLQPFDGIDSLQYGTLPALAPGGTAALVNLGGPVVFASWGFSSPPQPGTAG